MKKLFLLLLVLPLFSFGQIGKSSSLSDEKQEVGSVNLVNAIGTFNGKAKLTKAYGKYLISFQDQNYQKISKIVIVEFSATEEELNYLFDELKSTFKSFNKEEFRIEVGNATLIYNLYRKKEMKITAILKSGEKGYFTTNAAALHILFGKKWDKKVWKNYLNS